MAEQRIEGDSGGQVGARKPAAESIEIARHESDEAVEVDVSSENVVWRKDDPNHPGSEYVLRRLRNIPEHFQPQDPATGEPKVLNGALLYRDNGMSVHLSHLLRHERFNEDDLCDWATHSLGRVTIETLRGKGGGVVADEDRGDANAARGRAHGLVRTDDPPPDKDRWKVLRDELRRKMDVKVSRDEAWVAPRSGGAVA